MAVELDRLDGVRSMKASEFKATCLKLIDEVAESHEEIVVTKHGQPLVRVSPYHGKPKNLWGRDRGKMEILGDIISPIDVEWEAETNPDRVLNPDL